MILGITKKPSRNVSIRKGVCTSKKENGSLNHKERVSVNKMSSFC